MPQLGETVIEGTVVRWLKHEGDAIAVDESLFEVSTDKVDTEVPSAYAGVVHQLVVAEGDTVPIGAVVAVIAGVDESLAEDPVADGATPPVGASTDGPSTARSTDDASTRRPTDDACTRRPATPGDEQRPPQPQERPAATTDGERGPVLSQVVRRLLDEHHLDPTAIVGTGRGGRITRSDVLAVAANRPAPERTETATPLATPGPTDEVVPFSRARRATAEHMRRSVASAAHALVAVEVDYGHLEPVRRANELSYLPFVARAVVAGLRAYPELNASVGDDCLVVHRRIHLGIAVDLDHEALVVPVVHDADQLRLPAFARTVAELASRARRHRLHPEELADATFTITNVGSFGTVVAVPIINQPQVAILSTDGVRMRPVARAEPDGGWSVAIHPVGNLSLSFDHRAVDGAYAAAFLARVRDVLETTDWSQEVDR